MNSTRMNMNEYLEKSKLLRPLETHGVRFETAIYRTEDTTTLQHDVPEKKELAKRLYHKSIAMPWDVELSELPSVWPGRNLQPLSEAAIGATLQLAIFLPAGLGRSVLIPYLLSFFAAEGDGGQSLTHVLLLLPRVGCMRPQWLQCDRNTGRLYCMKV